MLLIFNKQQKAQLNRFDTGWFGETVDLFSSGRSDRADPVSFWHPVCRSRHCGPCWWRATCEIRRVEPHPQSPKLHAWRRRRYDHCELVPADVLQDNMRNGVLCCLTISLVGAQLN